MGHGKSSNRPLTPDHLLNLPYTKHISKTPMHDSTLDLFCNHADDDYNIDEAFYAAFEEEAAKLEVTVDYYMEEFLV